MKTTKTSRTKIYGDWGQLRGILVYNYVKENNSRFWIETRCYYVENKNYRNDIR